MHDNASASTSLVRCRHAYTTFDQAPVPWSSRDDHLTADFAHALFNRSWRTRPFLPHRSTPDDTLEEPESQPVEDGEFR